MTRNLRHVAAATAALCPIVVLSPTTAQASTSQPRTTAHSWRCGQSYAARQVGDLGGSGAYGLAINLRGQVAGTARPSTTARPQLPYVQRPPRAAVALPVPEGSTFGRAMAINLWGESAGEVFTAAPESSRAAFWDRRHKLHQLKGLGPTGSAVANSVNDLRTVVGSSASGDKRVAAVAWPRAANPKPLPFLVDRPGAVARATDINDFGTIVGSSSALVAHEGHDHLVGHAVRWRHGKVSDLGALTTDGYSTATALSLNNTIVGEATDSTGATRAVRFAGGRAIALPALVSWKHSTAKDVNVWGQIVGSSSKYAGNPSFGGSATLWQCGRATDLNTVTSGLPAGWTMLSADAINDRGQIVGYGTNGSGVFAAFRLSPRH